jgi:hypothetical protein
VLRATCVENEAKKTAKLPAHRERAVAVEAAVDPRTVRRFIAGEDVRPMVRERIERALVRLGEASNDE